MSWLDTRVGLVCFVMGLCGVTRPLWAMTCGEQKDSVNLAIGEQCELLTALNAIPADYPVQVVADALVGAPPAPDGSQWMWPTPAQREQYSWLFLFKIKTWFYYPIKLIKGVPLAVKVRPDGVVEQIYAVVNTAMMEYVRDDYEAYQPSKQSGFFAESALATTYFHLAGDSITPQVNFALPQVLEQSCQGWSATLRQVYQASDSAYNDYCMRVYDPEPGPADTPPGPEIAKEILEQFG